MPMVTHSIKNLINGVSQQPASMRLSSQAEVQENGYSTLLDGLGKRPHTTHIANLLSSSEDFHVHFINRDTSERYIVLISSTSIRVFDLETGAAITVTAPYGDAYLAAAAADDFQCVTVADHTFVLNKSKTVSMLSTTSPAKVNNALVWVKVGLYSTTYTVTLTDAGGDHTATYNSPASTGDANLWKSEYIALQLGNYINVNFTNYLAVAYGSQVIIVRKDGTDFTIKTVDSYGDQAMSCAKGTVQKYQDLPAKAVNNFKVMIEGDPTSRADNYYLQYTQTDNANGVWKEVVGWGLQNRINPATMPHKLVRQGDGTFIFEECEWSDREVGDEDTCPTPSFVGKTISDIFYYRNRLGFLSDENVILSAADDYYNFWPETAMQNLETDPIDTAVGSEKISVLRHAVPLMSQMLLFADQVQFSQTSNTALSPMDIQIDQTTSYDYSSLAKPVAAGSSIFFSTKRGQYTGIMEYLIDPDTKINQAVDMTAHVPKYIPTGVFKLVVGVNINVLLCLTLEERNAVYVYNFWWEGSEKVQSAWHKWIFGEDDVILSAEIIDSIAYFLIKRDGSIYLESLDMMTSDSDTDLGYQILIDRRTTLTGVYDADTGITEWTLPYPVAVTDPVTVVRGPDFVGNGISIYSFRNTTGSSYKVYARGDHTDGECYVGVPYLFRYQLSEQFLKEDTAETVSIVSGRLQLHQMTVRFSNSIYFKAVVTPTGSDTFEYATDVRINEVAIGTPVPTSGTFAFPVLARSELVSIEIQNDTHYPCYLQSIDWKARYIPKAQRM